MKRTGTSDQATIDRWDCCHHHPYDLEALSFLPTFPLPLGLGFFIKDGATGRKNYLDNFGVSPDTTDAIFGLR